MSERNGKYYTLALYSPFTRKWLPEFGDYDLNVVKAERDSYLAHGAKAKNMVIFHTLFNLGQDAIDEQIRKLNERGE